MKKIYFLFIIILSTCQLWSQQFTAIPDPVFEQHLIDNYDDDVLDGQVLTSKINGITYLNVNSKGISSLVGIKDFTSLENLNFVGNNLTSLDLSNMPNLTYVVGYANSLTTLDITGLNLYHLEIDSNNLTSIDVSACTNLHTLWTSYNPVGTLDLSNNVNLVNLYCSSSQLTSLNLSGLINLQGLDATDNLLENLDLKGLVSLGSMNCYGNPLTCITVDNVAAAEAQNNWFKDTSASYNTVCVTPGTTSIPDTAFEAYLINQGFDTVADGLVTTAVISGITTLNVASLGISNLTGIQDFTALQSLDCSNNQLTSLNINMLSGLVELVCSNNQLNGLNISGLNNLQVLDFSNNAITAMDFGSAGAITSLAFSNNGITSVAIGNLTGLTSLECDNNGLEVLDLTGLNNLDNLNCQNNNLTELDLTGSNLTTFSAQGNVLLGCIKVNDVAVALANSNWTIDAASSYNTACASPLFFAVPDANFESALVDMLYDDVVDGKVLKSNVTAVETLDVSSKGITNLIGIRYFTALKDLNCSNNAIISLSINGLSSLETLNCGNNQLQNLSLAGLTNLETLNANSNGLSQISLNPAMALKFVNLDDNNIGTIDIESMFNLEELHFAHNNATSFVTPALSPPLMNLKKLYCNNNSLESVVLNNMPNLEYLDCSHNLLSGFDALLAQNMQQLKYANISNNNVALNNYYFSGLSSLETLICSNNIVNEYNWVWSDFPALKHFDCSHNQIASMGTLPANLLTMDCSFNKITALDFNQATSLTSLVCTNNKFIVLGLEGFPAGATLDCTSNSALTCILVADIDAANANTNWTKDANASYATDCSAAYYVSIPDPVFEQYLIDQGYDDDNGTTLDGKVLIANIANVTNLYLQFSAVTDLTGIKAFGSLVTLYCSFSPGITALDVSGMDTLKTLNAQSCSLTSIDLSGVTALESLSVSGNQLISLDLSGLTNIKELECGDNQLAALTIASTQLTSLGCRNNDLTSLNTSGMTALTSLDCNGNQIASLDLTGMTHLTNLDCSYNALTALNTSDLTDLTNLNCRNNQLSGILNLTVATELYDLNCGFNNLTGLNVSGLTSLEYMDIRYNGLTSLDVSGLTSLNYLYSGNNQLTDLNITNTTLESLDIYSNAFQTLDLTALPDTANMSCFQNNSLTCIKVNDVAIAENNSNWSKDQDALYALDCGGITLIPDPNFEQALIDNGYDTVINGQVPTSAIMAAGYIDAVGYGITDMTGLQDFKSLVALECQNNSITSLPLEGLEYLVFLKLDNNQVTSLDLSHTPNLEQLYCRNNQITALDFTGLDQFVGIDCSRNQITALDFSGLQNLVQINTSNNPLTVLNLDNTPGLLVIQSNSTLLTELDVTDSPLLEYLEVYDNQLTSLDVAGLQSLEYLDCGENQISTLDVSSLSNLIEYYCYDNQLTSIDVAGLDNLLAISCYGNQITDLDETTLSSLQYLDCAENNLTSLDLSGMADLSYMDCRYNILTCIKVSNVAGAQAQWGFYKDTEDSYNLSCDVYCSQVATWDGNAWTPSSPLPDQKAVFTGNYTSSGDLLVCELEVAGTAEVTIASGHDLIVFGSVKVAPTASLSFNNRANLLQDPMAKNSSNTGSVAYSRNSSALYNLDYTIWSSPTSGAQTLKEFSPNTLDVSFFVYNTLLNAYSNYQSQSGVFGSHPNAVTFTQGKGYLIRMPAGLPADATSTFAGIFKGTPNNGDITIGLSTAGNRFNAVGNPYPSPINIHSFINGNQSQLDNGTLYFWRKKNLATTTTYATITKLAYAATDGAIDTGTTFTGQPRNWVINPGQGFLVKASATATELSFDNMMRVGTNNTQFFRPGADSSASVTSADDMPMSRFWLDISNGASSFGQAVIGYTDETTNGLDYGWDGRLYNDADLSIYTTVESSKLAIQARAPFIQEDVVPVSYNTNNGGTFSISMSNYDGLFETNQDVYLKDNVFSVWHNLKEGPYSFSSEAGIFDARFEVRYQNSALGVGDPVFDSNNVIIYKQGTTLNIDAGKINMKEVQLYDIRGRLIYSNTAVDAVKFTIDNLMVEQQVLIVQITAQDNSKVNKKIIY